MVIHSYYFDYLVPKMKTPLNYDFCEDFTGKLARRFHLSLHRKNFVMYRGFNSKIRRCFFVTTHEFLH
jgi:hypothetical protein